MFHFNNKIYLQVRGTATGTKCAPVYATLVMVYLEPQLYKKIEQNFGRDIRNKFEKDWGRYLDYCFINWDTNISPIQELHNILNNLHPRIKCTMEYDQKEMNFLDINLKVKGKKIITDIYYKSTDTHNHVPFLSKHPKHTLINIPYNLARRLCTIVDERTTLEQRLNQLRDILRHQDYPEKIIENGTKKAKSIPQETLRKPTEKSTDKNTLTFVSTHNLLNPDIFQIIKRTLSVLNASPRMKQAMTNKRIIQSKRQPPDLKKMITRARFTMEETDSQPKIQNPKL